MNIDNIEGKIVKEDDRYKVIDNTSLNNLVVSSTLLHADKSTTGHKHEGQEEVYMFMKGSGKMELDDKVIEVKEGDLILIEDGVFHRVHNTGSSDLYMVCIFDGGRNH
ncbi:MAG: cupin domain-containing protein [Gammaproteobacteria bacterium]|jgi:mannose-6-phosphate isomerase-like protein (cupin superfamily)|nr:cupin domain-containing protein [Gammaproteobacteria bacterium]MDP6974580.1 cupin domain-containing protein [Gammaproteobacteria bacterium]